MCCLVARATRSLFTTIRVMGSMSAPPSASFLSLRDPGAPLKQFFVMLPILFSRGVGLASFATEPQCCYAPWLSP